MRLAIVCGTAMLAFGPFAEAQGVQSWTPPDCASVEAGSLEAALMDCELSSRPLRDTVVDEDRPSVPGATLADERFDAEPDDGSRMAPDGTHGHAVNEPLEQGNVHPTEGTQTIRPSFEALQTEKDKPERFKQEDRRGKKDETAGLEIPNGHRPPPGFCRVWYPNRPAGHQPPPTSCDVDVPRGAVLVR